MKTLSLVYILLFVTAAYGQTLEATKFNNKDSIELTRTWRKFKTALELEDKETLRRLSLKTVHCDLFQNPNPNTTYDQDVANSFIPFNTFLAQFYHDLPKLKLWSVMKTKKYHIGESAINFHPQNIKSLKEKPLKIYDIWYVTFEPNEITKGDEGESQAFEFVKINGKFLFYGLTSIP